MNHMCEMFRVSGRGIAVNFKRAGIFTPGVIR